MLPLTNPFLLAALQGLAKGLFANRSTVIDADGGYSVFGAPVIEETMYRWAPEQFAEAAGKTMPQGLSAAIFAIDHAVEAADDGDTTSQVLMRLTDVFLGGLVYEKAFKAYGLLGAIGAHALHNLSTRIAVKAAGAQTAPAHTRGTRSTKGRTRR